jgi:hypothetical protein
VCEEEDAETGAQEGCAASDETLGLRGTPNCAEWTVTVRPSASNSRAGSEGLSTPAASDASGCGEALRDNTRGEAMPARKADSEVVDDRRRECPAATMTAEAGGKPMGMVALLLLFAAAIARVVSQGSLPLKLPRGDAEGLARGEAAGLATGAAAALAAAVVGLVAAVAAAVVEVAVRAAGGGRKRSTTRMAAVASPSSGNAMFAAVASPSGTSLVLSTVEPVAAGAEKRERRAKRRQERTRVRWASRNLCKWRE